MKDNSQWNFGRFVRVRERSDGTHRVFMSVPARLRPSGWPANIALPEIGSKIGCLTDPKFNDRVAKDAIRLNERLDLRREMDALAAAPDKTLPKLAELYIGHADFKGLSVSRQYRNTRSVSKILEWSVARGHPAVEDLSALDVDDFLSVYCDRWSTRFDMRSSWNMLFKTAKYARWIRESPLEKGNWKTPVPRQVAVWKSEDVERYAEMAWKMGQPGLAAMVVLLMATGQRVGDLRKARWGREYLGDRLVIMQSKTKKLVNIPVDDKLRRIIAAVRLPGSDFLFNDHDTKTGFTDSRLTARFNEVRHAATSEGQPLLHLRGLRHACVCRLFLAGLNVAQTAAITGHVLAGVHRILERYFPDRFGLADSGMKHAYVAEGGNIAEFGDVAPLAANDWEGDHDRMARYAAPEFTEANFERLLAARTGQHRQRVAYPSWAIFDETEAEAEDSDAPSAKLIKEPA